MTEQWLLEIIEFHYNKGVEAYKHGRYEEGLEHYKTALKFNPKYHLAYYGKTEAF